MKTRRINLRFSSLLLFVCSLLPAHAADWPYYQHDAAHTGATTAIVNPANLTLSWSAPQNYSNPLIVGDTIYATRNQGGYYGGGNATLISAFDLVTGAIKWTFSGDFSFPSEAAVGGGFVVFHTGIAGDDPGKLYVLDAMTGALRYTVPVPNTPASPISVNVMPLLVPNPADGTVTAYCAEDYLVYAVSLGPSSGSVLWTQPWGSSTASIPTLVGDSIILAGPGRFCAFDINTGAPNMFHWGNVHGGGGTTVAYDSARQHIYILEEDTGSHAGKDLSAFRYSSNAQIERVWQRIDSEIGSAASVAIGPSGKLYFANGSLLLEVDPDTGTTLRSVSGVFRTGQTPAITAGMLWVPGYHTQVYDLQTLQLVRTFPGPHFFGTYAGPGAFAEGYFVFDYGTLVGQPGFDVYSAPAAQALNLSTRMRVEVGDNVGIGGFIITGSVPKQVLLRGIGPSLTGFGVPDALTDPVMELHGPAGFATITNDNWRDTQAATIQATGLAPTNDLESAILVTLNPGPYTALLKGMNNTAGTALVEVYDLDHAAASKLGNISTRAFVSTGFNIVIAGFILGHNAGYDNVVVRGIGPSLSASGVPNALTNPTLELRDSNGALVIGNDNWQDNPSQAAIISAAGLAPTNALESAIAATLPPGAYTALLTGLDNGTGVGLVEVYDRGAP